MSTRPNEEKNHQKESAQPGTDRSDETNVGSDARSPERLKTHREKRLELHQTLTEIVAREARQQRLRDGTASEGDSFAEARAIEDDASAKSRRILSGAALARC